MKEYRHYAVPGDWKDSLIATIAVAMPQVAEVVDVAYSGGEIRLLAVVDRFDAERCLEVVRLFGIIHVAVATGLPDPARYVGQFADANREIHAVFEVRNNGG